MPVTNCSMCGNPVYGQNLIGICKNCVRRSTDDTMILIIKKYMDNNPDALVEDVIRDTGIPYSKIVAFEKEGRIVVRRGNISDLANRINGSRRKTREQISKEMMDYLDEKSNRRAREIEDNRSQLLKDLEEKRGNSGMGR